ncbi:hypothetical protein AB1Y20_011809 [Prymnesium parvum]|uniref:Probable beta-glucosidase G n=1 Tax=Prymnesium parvum TaxID=97485 RepID=A0AB34IK66_PRYPA
MAEAPAAEEADDWALLAVHLQPAEPPAKPHTRRCTLRPAPRRRLYALLRALLGGLAFGYSLAAGLEAADVPLQPTIVHRAVVAAVAILLPPLLASAAVCLSSLSCCTRCTAKSPRGADACNAFVALCVVTALVLAAVRTSSRDNMWTALSVLAGHTTPLPEGYCALATREAAAARRRPAGEWWRPYGPNASVAAANLSRAMSEEERRRLVEGTGWGFTLPLDGFYVGNLLAVPRLGIPPIQLQDASQGFRTVGPSNVGRVTSFPTMLALGATWDAPLIRRVAAATAREFRAKGANVLLGPGVAVHRVPRGGRNVELIAGEEPMLGAALGAAFVRGVQSEGIAAVAKHFMFNQQETRRMSASSDVADRVLMEQYAVPFAAAAAAGVAGVMCSYNLENGTYSCANQRLLHVLRQRLKFDGFVVSDWWAVHSPADAGTADINMPGNDGFFSAARLPATPLHDMATHILTGMLRAHALDLPPACVAGCDCEHRLLRTNATSARHVALAEEAAAASVVLLKNAPRADGRPPLPLRPADRVALLGSACVARQHAALASAPWDESDYFSLGGSGRVVSDKGRSIRDELEARHVSLVVSPTDSLDAALAAMAGASVALACAGGTTTEGRDRPSLRLDQHDFLARLAASPRSVPLALLLFAPGAIEAPYAAAADGAAALFLAGQASGAAWAAVLTGEVTPSAKLPVTFPLDDAPPPPCGGAALPFLGPAAEYLSFGIARCAYAEGLHGGWRGMVGRPVAFPFGHGLSFTTFQYAWAAPPSTRRLHASGGGESELRLHVSVTNAGGVAGAEVVQLYMGFPEAADEPPLVLRGFEKTALLQPGENTTIHFTLSTTASLTVWHGNVDDDTAGWRVATGNYSIFVGSSSRDARLYHFFECV